MTSTPRRIVVSDSQQMVAEALGDALRARGVDVVGVAHTASGTVDAVRRHQPDVLVLSSDLGLGGAPELLRDVSLLRPAPRILLTASCPAIDSLQRAIDSGCGGYVSKEAPLSELVDAIAEVGNGDTFYSADALMTLLRRREQQPASTPPISEREREVLQLLAEGASITQIAATLHLSAHTVKNHVRRAMAHLGVHTRLEAVLAAARSGLVQLDPDPEGDLGVAL